MRPEFKAQVDRCLAQYDYQVHPALSQTLGGLKASAQTAKERRYVWTVWMEVYRRWAMRSDPDLLPGIEGLAGESWKRFGETPTFGASDVIDDIYSWLRSISEGFEVQPGIAPVPGEPPSIEIVCSESEYDFVRQEWKKVKHLAGAVPVKIVVHGRP